jgi:thioredoxin 1
MKDKRYLIALAILLICGCEQPKEPCCPKGSCEPVVKVLWFSAGWCGPCKRQAPEAEEALAGYNWRKVDIDSEPSTKSRHKVGAVPTYIVFVNGREMARTNDAKELKRILRR